MKTIVPVVMLMLLACSRGEAPLVRTADLRITVEDTEKSVTAITKSIEARGGYVSGSNIWREGDSLRATLTLRVPSGKLTETLASIRGLAKRVENEVVTSAEHSTTSCPCSRCSP